ncbi:TetR/AcrR family transcriptional regulator [Kribbella sp. CA-253562]|uniref:TetR/AcrR family transcriptional regulator n=1 Tax=Kribbella sp. CA-253562 TaxID=3239942 RepID=UPI003D907164
MTGTVGRHKEFDPDVAVMQAMEVFWRQGYARTTPQDLVDALGIGKGSLYNAFGSKQALFELALRQYRDSQVQTLIDLLDEAGPVKERLRAALWFLVETDFADPARPGCFAVNSAAEVAGSNEAAAELVRRMFEQTEDAFRALVEQGQRTGEIALEVDALSVASLLVNTVIGLRLQSRIAEGPERHERVIRALVATL